MSNNTSQDLGIAAPQKVFRSSICFSNSAEIMAALKTTRTNAVGPIHPTNGARHAFIRLEGLPTVCLKSGSNVSK